MTVCICGHSAVVHAQDGCAVSMSGLKCPCEKYQPNTGRHREDAARLEGFRAGKIDALAELGRAREEALAAGFADCEALVVAMLEAMASREEDAATCLFERVANLPGEEEKEAVRTLALRALHRAQALREAALAISLGQHRTDAYDPDDLARAHRRAGITDQQRIAGGKARQAQLTPARRQKLAKKAAAARWKKGE